MENNEDTCVICLPSTEILGVADEFNVEDGEEQEGPLAPEEINLLSDTSDEESELNEELAGGSEPKPDSKIIDGDFHLIATVAGTNIRVPSFSVQIFLKRLKIKNLQVAGKIQLHITDSKGTDTMSNLAANMRSSPFSGRLGCAASVIRCFKLESGQYKLNYCGQYERCVSEEDPSQGTENVYKFEVGERLVEEQKGTFARETKIKEEECIEEEEDEGEDELITIPEWASGASELPLVPADLPDGVSKFWDAKVVNASNGLRLTREPYIVFMDQIGQAYKRRAEVHMELETDRCGTHYAIFSCVQGSADGFFRYGIRLCREAGFFSGDTLRMHYNGHRVLQDGEKMHCFRVKRVSRSRPQPQRDVYETRKMAAPAADPVPSRPAPPSFIPTWVKEATKQSIVSVVLPNSVPLKWATKVTMNGRLRVQTKGYTTFLRQIGIPPREDREILLDLIFESHQNFYTSLRGGPRNLSAYFKRPEDIRSRFKLQENTVLKMEYVGYRPLPSNGKKVHCLLTEKISVTPENRAEMERLCGPLGGGRKRRSPDTDSESETDSDRQQQQRQRQQPPPATDDKKVAPKRREPLVSKKTAAPSSSYLNTFTPSPHPGIPEWVQRAQGVAQYGDAGASGSRQREPAPQQQQQQQRQQQQRQELEQPVEDLADLVIYALTSRSDLSDVLVGSYLSIFSELPERTQEIQGKVILRLSAERSVTGLQAFLERAIQQHT